MTSIISKPMGQLFTTFSLLVICVSQTSCHSISNSSATPLLFPEFLEGPTYCKTTINTYFGIPLAKMNLNLIVHSRDNTHFEIHERTMINGVHTGNRTYKIVQIEPHKWLVTSSCIVGEGIGLSTGNTIQWNYESWEKLPNGRIINLQVKEEWSAVNQDKIQVKQLFQKYGIPLAFGKGSIVKLPNQTTISSHLSN